MSERKAKLLRKLKREALLDGTLLRDKFSKEAEADFDRRQAAYKNMERAQQRNADRIRAEFGGKVADAAMVKGRAERRRYLRNQRKKGMSHGRG